MTCSFFSRQAARQLLCLIIGLLGLLGSPWLSAGSNLPFLKIAGEEEYDLGPYFVYLEDPDSTLTFDDISTPEVEKLFTKSKNDYINFAVSASTFWLRAEIRHVDKKQRFEARREWFLDIRRARLDIAELYVKRADGSVQFAQSDLRIPYDQRPIKNVNSVFPLVTERGESLLVYLKIKNDNATYLPIHLRTAPNFIRTDTSHDLLYGMFFGGMLVLIFYNLFLLISIRDVSYFYYVAYLVPVTLFEFIDIGHGISLFESLPELFHKKIMIACIWFPYIAGILFTIQFLNIAQRTPAFHVFLKALVLFCLVAVPISYQIQFDTALLFTAYFCSYGSCLIIALGLYHWYRYDDTNAALMTGAWMFCVLGYLLYGGLTTGWMPPNGIIIASLPLGTLLEAVMLAFALGEHIKRTQNQVLLARQRSIMHLNRFRSFFDNAAEGIYQLSLDGRWLSANQSMARIMGFDTTRALLDASRKASAQLFQNRPQRWRSLLDARQLRDEISLVHDSGAIRYAIHSAKLIRHAGGTPSHIEGSLIDLTERRQNEQAQRARLKERHEKELAKNTTESKSGFLKNMSYQIRTPLTAIIGFSESLQQPYLGSESRRHAINSVVRNANTLLQLVNDILDFSKIEAGKMMIESIDIDLMALLRQIQQHCEPLAREKQINYRLDCRFPLPARIKSDPTRLRQILHNLCSNAIKYTPQGTVKLIVRWDGINQHLCFDVEDSGIGLAPEEIRQLLSTSTGVNTLNTSMTGGLGISITRHLLNLLGGQLHIDSRKNYGSRFTATIACKTTSKDDWLKQAPSPAATATSGTPQLSGSVLLAEDNVVNQKLISRLIGKTGAQVTLAENGQQAVDLAQQHVFDLILMDVNMPVMDGLTASRHLKASGITAPICALTAENGAEEIQACLAAGCVQHLSKPIDIPQFYATLAQYLMPNSNREAEKNQH